MRTVPHAPTHLVTLYNRRSKSTGQFNAPHRYILVRLLTHPKMNRAWKTLARYLETPQSYEEFYKAVLKAMRLARHGIVSKVDRRDRYERIAKRAESLADFIAVPRLPPRDGSVYRGDLDLEVNELLSREWKRIIAYYATGLRSWPTMVELLNQLAIQAREKARESVTVGRQSRLGKESTKARLFACYLHDELAKFCGDFGHGVTITAIASAVYGLDLDSDVIKKALFDHRKKKRNLRGE